MATSKKTSITPSLLPMDFKTFAKNPVVATLFIVLGAIGYLYIDSVISVRCL